MKKALALFCIFCCSIVVSFGQQDPLFNNYLLNSLPLNPAFAGSKGYVHIALSTKQQWSGIENAPRTSLLSIHNSNTEDKIGYGLSILNDRIGISTRSGAMANASYKLETKHGKLSFGLGFGMYNINNDWSQIDSEEGDPVFEIQNESIWNTNFSAGLYYYQKDFFASISTPMIFNNVFDNKSFGSYSNLGMSYTNKLYIISGYNFQLNKVTLRPSVLFRYNEKNPSQLDLNLTAEILNRVEIGTFYRPKLSISGFAKVRITDQLYIGYSIESPFSIPNGINNESHELTISVDLMNNTNAKNTSVF